MSGPITVLVSPDPITVLLSAAVITARSIQDAYARAEELRGEHSAARDATRAAQDAAGQQGRAALEGEAKAAEARFAQLLALAARIGAAERVRATSPERPESNNPIALAAYVRGLQTLSDRLQGILLVESARQKGDGADQPADLTDLAIAIEPAPPLPQRASQKLLARIAHLGPTPEDIAKLALELDDTPGAERAALLTTELHGRIQAHIESLQRRLVQEATATIVEQSLKDLGYQVEEVAHTLFVEGGVVHFRRPGWGDHMVRMRVDRQGGAANFNVVRAAGPGSNERSVLDHIAEDRWCTEFPALLNALEVRGVRLNVTRRLAAGELPVQLVERSKLPAFADEETAARSAPLRQREIK
jgi:hypothetical protein